MLNLRSWNSIVKKIDDKKKYIKRLDESQLVHNLYVFKISINFVTSSNNFWKDLALVGFSFLSFMYLHLTNYSSPSPQALISSENLAIQLRPFGLLVPKDIAIIWLSNILILRVPDDCYSSKESKFVPCGLHYFSTVES